MRVVDPGAVEEPDTGVEVQLPDLFLQGHAPQQVVHPPLNWGIAVLIDGARTGIRLCLTWQAANAEHHPGDEKAPTAESACGSATN